MERIRHEIYGGPKLSDILKVGGSAVVGFVVGLAGVALCGETAGAGCFAAAGAVAGLASQCVADCKNATALGLSALLGAVAGGVGGLKGDPAYANLESEVGVTEDPAAATDPAGCPANSFTGDTPVLMADGIYKPISQVKVGDEVLATDPATGITGREPVTGLIRHTGRHDMVAVALADGSTLDATAGHPVWDETTGRFTNATAVRVGDRVVTTGGRLMAVVSVRRYSEVLTAYNLHIDVIHTFYAGTTPVLVHNGCGGETSAAATGRAIHKQVNNDLIEANKTNSLWEPGLTSGPNRPDGSTIRIRSSSNPTLRPESARVSLSSSGTSPPSVGSRAAFTPTTRTGTSRCTWL
jgi:hypothetical protein